MRLDVLEKAVPLFRYSLCHLKSVVAGNAFQAV